MASRAPSPLVALAACALALGSAASGCGPSLRRVHEGNVYFERCYAADLDLAVPAEERRACWQAWHAYYQTGASPERIDHATERLAMLDPEQAEAIALATGDDSAAPSTEAGPTSLMGIVSAETTTTIVPATAAVDTTDPTVDAVETVEPSPTTEPIVAATETPSSPPLIEDTSTHLAIVEAEERARAAERRSHRSIVVPRSSTPHCQRTCHPLWERCTSACSADDRGCVGACRRELTICSRGCY